MLPYALDASGLHMLEPSEQELLLGGSSVPALCRGGSRHGSVRRWAHYGGIGLAAWFTIVFKPALDIRRRTYRRTRRLIHRLHGVYSYYESHSILSILSILMHRLIALHGSQQQREGEIELGSQLFSVSFPPPDRPKIMSATTSSTVHHYLERRPNSSPSAETFGTAGTSKGHTMGHNQQIPCSVYALPSTESVITDSLYWQSVCLTLEWCE